MSSEGLPVNNVVGTNVEWPLAPGTILTEA